MSFLLTLILSFSLHADPSAEDRASVPEVMMNHYLVASVKEFPAIQTYGVATCVAVLLYDHQKQVGAIMHVSASTDIPQALNIVLNEIEQKAGTQVKLEASLLGGWDNSMGEDSGMTYESGRMVSQLISGLNQESIPIVQNETLVTKEKSQGGWPAILNMEINLSNGEIVYFEQVVEYSGGDISVPMPEVSYF